MLRRTLNIYYRKQEAGLFIIEIKKELRVPLFLKRGDFLSFHLFVIPLYRSPAGHCGFSMQIVHFILGIMKHYKLCELSFFEE